MHASSDDRCLRPMLLGRLPPSLLYVSRPNHQHLRLHADDDFFIYLCSLSTQFQQITQHGFIIGVVSMHRQARAHVDRYRGTSL